MRFVYHGVPEKMVGTRLVPLNEMQAAMPGVREQNLKKYEGREEILERKVPLLDCLWNDVLQFLPLDPQKVFELQKELGLIPEVPAYSFYQIDLGLFSPLETVVFFKIATGEENTDVKWLTDVDFVSLQEVPNATLEYYKTLIGTGELPFNYQFIPHVLYRGNVNIAQSKIITLE